MFKSRQVIAFSMAFLLLILLSGCWDQVGMDQRTLVIGMGVDRIPGDKPIRLTVQVINFRAFRSSGGSGSINGMENGGSKTSGRDSVVVETSQGRTFSDAIQNLLKYSSRQVTFSHNRIVILGSQFARSGIAGVFDEMARNGQFRPTDWIFVTDTTAQAILESRTDLGTAPAYEMSRMMTSLTKNALVIPTNQNDLIFQLKSESHAGLTPLVRIESSDNNPFSRVMLGEMAVFKSQRLVAILNEMETNGALWLNNEPKGGWVVLLPDQPGKNSSTITVKITDGFSRIEPRIHDGAIEMVISCTGKGTLLESEGVSVNSQSIEHFERKIEGILKGRVVRTIKKAQRINADFPGFARLIHAEYPAVWHKLKPNWDKEFPQIRFRVEFSIKLTRVGGIKDSLFKGRR